MLHVLVLTSAGANTRTILHAARDGERAVALASTLAEYRSLTTPYGDWVVIYDLNAFPAQPAEVLEHANLQGIPVIVVANRFDSTDWIRLFKLGACDVLRSPVIAGELSRSIASASKRLATAAAAAHADRWYTRTLQWAKRLLILR